MKTFTKIIAIALLLTTGSLFAQEDSVVKITVKVERLVPTPFPGVMEVRSYPARGTGCVIEKDGPFVQGGAIGYVATAAHVVMPSSSGETISDIQVHFKSGLIAKDCKVVAHHKAKDTAIIECWIPTGTPEVDIAQDSTKQGDEVTWYGQSGIKSKSSVRAKCKNVDGKWICQYSDLTVIQGDSGGPVINSKGQIVGVISGGHAWVDDRLPTQKDLKGKSTWPARCSTADVLKDLWNQIKRSKPAQTPSQVPLPLNGQIIQY